VREERVLRRIEDLKIPPVWDEVRIARSPSAKVQAIGYDSAGRLRHHAEVGENLKKEQRCGLFRSRVKHAKREMKKEVRADAKEIERAIDTM
jgi:DNA topoisomerase I